MPGAPTTIRWALTEHLIALIRTRQVYDGATVNGDATVTSASAAFVSTDVGKPIAGTGIPNGATIATVTSATEVELSAPATGAGTGVTLTIGVEDLAGVQVEPGWPGDQLEAEAVWVDELDGEVTYPVMVGGRKHRDDKFTIPFQIRVAGQSDLDSTMTRLSEIVAAIEDVFADDPSADGFTGLIDAVISRERMTSGDLRGAGVIGFGEITVACHARYE
ncbi:MAG: hypothetical protein FJW95_08215 [Actinobacteria bacterium]|nr:hypothetical protein [Actinomycetota bacterium]